MKILMTYKSKAEFTKRYAEPLVKYLMESSL